MFDKKVQNVIRQVAELRDQVDDHWMVPDDEAVVLAQLVRAGRCRLICEIGTSYGFSTLHLAAAVRETGGGLHSFDINPKKIDAARRHLEAAGLIDTCTLHLGDAIELLDNFTLEQPIDFAFIDAVKSQCFDYFEQLLPHLAEHALIATDNTLTHADELADFQAHLRELKLTGRCVQSCNVPVGNGFELTVISPA